MKIIRSYNTFVISSPKLQIVSSYVAGASSDTMGEEKGKFTGNATVVPTCTYLGDYSLAPSSCKDIMLGYPGSHCSSVRLQSKGDAESNSNAWYLSGVSRLGDVPTAGKVWGARCPSSSNHLNFKDDENGQISLNIGSKSQLIPVAANPEEVDDAGFCSNVRLFDPSSGKYLAVENCESPTFKLASESDESTIWTANQVSSYDVRPNHEEDADVSISASDSSVLFASRAPNSSFVDSTLFPAGLVQVGLNKSYDVISFICPHASRAGVEIEVQLGKIGGKFDPDTGAALIAVDNVHWLAWGDIPGPNGKVTIDKENALKLPLVNVTGGTGFLLSTTTTDTTPDNTALTLAVQAITQSPDPNTSQENLALLQGIGQFVPPMVPGVEVFWALYLEAPKEITGSEYKDFATEANQGTGQPATASAVPPASASIQNYPCWRHRICAVIALSLMFL